MFCSLRGVASYAAALLAPCALSCVTVAGASTTSTIVDRESATVIFARPSLCKGDGLERLVMCDAFTQNRILVVDGEGRRVAELGPRDYAIVIQRAGQHLYVAQESGTSCAPSRPQCVAVLPAALEPGRTYVVAFVWHPLVRRGSAGLTMGEGRLDFAPIRAQTMPIVRRWMDTATRVEAEPPADAELAVAPRDARSRALTQLAERRLHEDHREQYPTPRIDGADGEHGEDGESRSTRVRELGAGARTRRPYD